MAAKEDLSPPFLPSTILHKTKDICFVHYQTPSPDQPVAANSHSTSRWRSCSTTPEVAHIRARQEEEAVRLIEAHLSEPYTVTVYSAVVSLTDHVSFVFSARMLRARNHLFFHLLRHQGWTNGAVSTQEGSVLLRWIPFLARVSTERKLAVFGRREQAYEASRVVGVVVSKLECISDGPCLLHGAQASNGCHHGGDEVARKAAGAEANSKGACEAFESKQESSFSRCEPGVPHKQRAGLGLEARGAQCSGPHSSALLCKCEGQCTASIAMLAVRPDMRGRGIGRQLVKLVLHQQQRLVRATQAAAFAEAPDCPEEHRGICEAVLSCRMPRPPFSSSMQLKLRRVQAAVSRAMAAGGGGEDACVFNEKACSSASRNATGYLQEKRLVCRLVHCSLDMEAGNAAAFRLYTSVGFVVAGYKRRYYCSGKDAYKMLYIF
ncbi:hypothetical protein ACSSS7_000116 [Eimeria intestinalis]